jgi:sn-glycerol 3-phosphate transport system substrate-binding protein
VKPIYAGTYQETIVKALTAHKSGEPPVTSVLLSTDMFTLIDEDAIVPIDSVATSAEDRAWLKSFFPAFMMNSQTGGKVWGVPFQRSTVVLYWNKELFKEAGLDPNKPPASWKEMLEYAQNSPARRLQQHDAMGHPGALVGLPLLALSGYDAERRRLMNAMATPPTTTSRR